MTKKKSILVVEDSEDIRHLIGAMLAHENWELIFCEDGVKAIEKLNSGLRPSVILSDVRMPRLSGLELALHVANEFPELTLILMSAQLEVRAPHLTSVHAKGFIRKPFTKDVLLQTLRAHLEIPTDAKSA